MPRGKKICPKCNAENGPRAFNCKQCQYEFIKKSQPELASKPVKNPKPKRTRKLRPPQVDLRKLFRETFQRHDDDTELFLSETYYNGCLETWRSKCGRYLIRYVPFAHGVKLEGSVPCYKLLVKVGDAWEPVGFRLDPEMCWFQNLKHLFKYYLALVENNHQVMRRKKKRIFGRKRHKP